MANEQGIRVRFTGETAGLEAASNRASNALKTVSKSSGATTVALTDVSRVIADMPYGLRGVANNLEQLGSSLGRVSFKDFVKGLAGPGGAIIGLSLVTSALTAAELKYGSLGNAIAELTSSSGTLVAAQRDIAKAFSEAQGKVAGEISNINALVSVARDETISRKARSEAINVLNKEYDNYLPKLTLENINSEKTAAAVNKLTASLLRQAKVRGLQDLIAKETQKQAELFQGSVTDNLSILDLFKLSLANAGNGGVIATNAITQGAKRTNEELNKSVQRITLFENKMQELLKAGAVEGTLFNPDVKLPKQIKIPELKLRAARVGLTFSEVGIEKSTLVKAKEFSPLSDILAGVGQVPVEPTIKLPEPDPEQIKRIKGYFASIGEFAAEVDVAVQSSLGGAFTNLFDDLLSGSQSAFASFGQALGNIIKKLLATAAAAAVLSLILGPLGLVKGGALNAPLKGFDLFRNIFGKIGGFAEGGVVSGPTSGYPAILHGKEVITPYDKFLDLVQGRSGGSESLVARVSGSDLLFVLNRAERSRGIIS